jgi:hypothetical protein
MTLATQVELATTEDTEDAEEQTGFRTGFDFCLPRALRVLRGEGL